MLIEPKNEMICEKDSEQANIYLQDKSKTRSQRRSKADKHFLIALNNRIINQIEYFDCGDQTKQCRFCLAKFFEKQVMKCCKNGDLIDTLYPIYLENEESIKKATTIMSLYSESLSVMNILKVIFLNKI